MPAPAHPTLTPESWPGDLPGALALAERLSAALRDDPRAARRTAAAFVRAARRATDPAVLAVALRARGHARRVARRIPEALADYAAARARFVRCGLPLEAARTAIGAVEALSIAGRPREAAAMARAARRAFARAGEPLRAARLDINLGNLHLRAGRPRAALARWNAAAAACEALGSDTDVAIARFNAGDALVQLDRPAEALPRLEASAAHWERLGRDAALAQARLALGDARFRLGEPAAALLALEQAAAAARRLGHRALIATAALARARVEQALNRWDRAAARLEEALPELEALALGMDEAEARARLAWSRLRLGDAGRAVDDLAAAEARAATARQPARRDWAAYLRALALRAVGRDAESRAGLRRAVRAFSRAGRAGLEAEARLALAAMEPDAGSAAVARALRRTARAARAQGDPWLAERRTRLAALHAAARGGGAPARAALERAHRALDALRRALPEEGLGAFLLADKDHLYEAAVELPARFPAAFAGRSGAAWALRWSERAHAPRLRDATAAGAGRTGAAGATEVRLARARARLHRLEAAARAEASAAGRGGARPERGERARLVAGIERLHRRLELERAARRGVPPPREIPVGRLLAALAPGETLIEYFAGARGLWAFRLERGAVAALRLAGDPEPVRLAAHRLRRLWDRARLAAATGGGTATLAAAERECLEELHARLVVPVLGDRGEVGGELAIVPHRWLHGVPFHALGRRDAALADRAGVRYGFTAAHALLPRPSRARGPVLLAGVSGPGAPSAEAEVEDLGRHWPGAVVLTGAAATPAAVLGRARAARLVHLAAHGDRRAADPRASGLLLHGGRLDVYDFDSVPLQADVVVLSACQTGESVLWGSDDAFGLLPALARSGVRSTIASLWPVGDAAARRWMSTLHVHLARGASAVAATRAAWLESRATGSTALEWAAFAPFGVRDRGG